MLVTMENGMLGNAANDVTGRVFGTVEFHVFDPAAPGLLSWRQFRVSEFRAKEDGWEYRVPGEELGWLPAECVRGFRLAD